MERIAVRIPDELETDLAEYCKSEGLDRSAAVRKLLATQLENWRRDRALDRFESGDCTLSRAADRADLSVWEFAALARERDVTWVGEDGLLSDLDEF